MSTAVRVEPARQRLRDAIEHEVAAVFARHAERARARGPEFAQLWSLAAGRMRGGKLVRPVLLLETFDAIRRAQGRARPVAQPPPGILDRAQAVRIAAAVEVLHAAFLLHDDVIDGDVLRRGRPNLIGELIALADDRVPGERARHCAETGGILMGDLLLSAAHQAFARLDADATTRIRLLDLLEHTIEETTAGELLDVALSDGVVEPDLDTVLAMTMRKTASYTFELPLRAAVILAGGSRELETALSAAGAHLGLAYQLQDDLLSTFGDAREHGKEAFSDLREGKQTAIVNAARMTSAWPGIAPHLGDPPLTAETAALLREALRECGAERAVQELVDEQLDAALALVTAEAAVPAEVRAVVMRLIARLEGRRA